VRPSTPERGITVTELLIVLAALGVLAMVGVPALSEFLANQRVRDAAEALRGSLLRARAQAVTRQREVAFTLPNPAQAAAEGASDDSPAIAIVATYPLGRTAANVIRFNPKGGTDLGGPVTLDVSAPGAGACAAPNAPGPIHCLRVRVSPSGQVAVCDPSRGAAEAPGCP
jgi:type IV fimbrial biogenesis protein FimT